MLHKASLTPVVNSVASLAGVTKHRQQSETNNNMAAGPAGHNSFEQWRAAYKDCPSLPVLLWNWRLRHWPDPGYARHAPASTWGTSRQVECCAKLCITRKISTPWERGMVSLVSRRTLPFHVFWQFKETFLWHLRLAMWCKTRINSSKSHTN